MHARLAHLARMSGDQGCEAHNSQGTHTSHRSGVRRMATTDDMVQADYRAHIARTAGDWDNAEYWTHMAERISDALERADYEDGVRP